MADPDFDLGAAEAVAQTKAVLHEQAFSGLLAMRGTGDNSLLTIAPVPALPGTAKEARAIEPSLQKFAGMEPAMLLGKQALKGVFKRVESPRVAVLSTHGFFFTDQQAQHDDAGNRGLTFSDEGQSAISPRTTAGQPLENPLLRCGLLLAGCNHRADATGDDDGVLTGLEIVGTDLRGTELVVLSACETGLGDIHTGQSVAGLRQAFQLAGAHAVVSTLWSIPDRETAELMTSFFSNLSQRQSKGEALQNAQRALIRSRRAAHSAAHPIFWAAFTLTGE